MWCLMLAFVSCIYVLLLQNSRKKNEKLFKPFKFVVMPIMGELLLLHAECWCHCYKRQLSYLSFSLRLDEIFFLFLFSFFEKNLFCLWRFCEKSSFEMCEIHIKSASVLPFASFPPSTYARTNYIRWKLLLLAKCFPNKSGNRHAQISECVSCYGDLMNMVLVYPRIVASKLAT